MNCSDINPKTITREEVLRLPDNLKRAYFRKVRVMHPRVAEVLEDMETVVLPESGTNIALLIGPTGVGKSVLALAQKERLIEMNKQEMMEDPSYIPVVHIEAPSSGEHGFPWRIFYIKLGTELNEPLMGKKFEENMIDGSTFIRQVTSGSTIAGMRMAIEGALKYRRTLLVLVDEAIHIIQHANGKTLIKYINTLKSLSNISGVAIALIGSYDLYNLMGLSGQLARRSAIIHFKRYIPGISSDDRDFKKTLKALQSYLPLENLPDLTVYADVLMMACVGCIGTLKETLERANTYALKNKGKWTEGCLEKALLTEDQVASILEEVLTGEKKIEKAIYGSAELGGKKKGG